MNKTILITGGAKGIGSSIALKFAELNYNICINYLTSDIKAHELKEKICNMGVGCDIYKADISKKDQVDQMISDIIKKYKKIDILVNNAAICSYGVFQDESQQDLKDVVGINLIGTFNVTQSVLDRCMINQKSGRIINISSMWGITGGSCEVTYSATKAGIIGFTKALAKELALSNILVNTVAPGVILTDMMKNFSKEELDDIKQQIPLQRFGTPEDVANVVEFLASNGANYITGQVISVDGGMVI